jgi:hypothetical protein
MEKKSEVLRFRVDVDTLTALKRRSDEDGENLSEILRQCIVNELAHKSRDAPSVEADVFRDSRRHCDGGSGRRRCAEFLSAILLRGNREGDAGAAEWRTKHRQVAGQIEMLLRLLAFPADFNDSVAPCLKDSDELRGADPVRRANGRAK